MNSSPFETIALFLPSVSGGGAERVFVQLANNFAERGHTVHIVLASATGPYLRELSPNVEIFDLKSPRISRSVPRLVKYMRKHRPAALLSGLEHANIVAAVAKCVARVPTRVVTSVRSLPSVAYSVSMSWRSRAVLKLSRITTRLPDNTIANSMAAADDYSEFFGVPRHRIDVIYNPIAIEQIQNLSRTPLTHAWFDQGSPPVILSVGRLDVLKDFPTLIKAFAIARQQISCRLLILGEGPERPVLEKLVAALDLDSDTVQMPGFHENPYRYMRRSAVFTSSSLTEGCPNALMQAMACGTPIVSTNSLGGVREVLEDGKWGRLVPVGDEKALADAIVSVLKNQDPVDVSQRANDYSLESISRQYLDILLRKASI